MEWTRHRATNAWSKTNPTQATNEAQDGLKSSATSGCFSRMAFRLRACHSATEGRRTSVSTVTAFCAVASKADNAASRFRVAFWRAGSSFSLSSSATSSSRALSKWPAARALPARNRASGAHQCCLLVSSRTSAAGSLFSTACFSSSRSTPMLYFFTGPRARADGATARLFTARLRGIAPRRRRRLVPSLSTAAFLVAAAALLCPLSTAVECTV
jgi:hypothetical protein